MPTIGEWRAEQARRRNEGTQPFVNQMTDYTYIPRQDGDPIPTGATAAATATNLAGSIPYGYYATQANYYYPYSFNTSYPAAYCYPGQPATTANSVAAQPATYYPQAQYYYPANVAGYGYGYYSPAYVTQPTTTATPLTLADGTSPWYGRTRTEVQYDNTVMANSSSTANVEVEIAPKGAKPGDTFWLYDPDVTGTGSKWCLTTYATIKEYEGSWKWDETYGSKRLVFHKKPKEK